MTEKTVKSKPRRGRPRKSNTKKPAVKKTAKPAAKKTTKQTKQQTCHNKFCICAFISTCWDRIRSLFC